MTKRNFPYGHVDKSTRNYKYTVRPQKTAIVSDGNHRTDHPYKPFSATTIFNDICACQYTADKSSFWQVVSSDHGGRIDSSSFLNFAFNLEPVEAKLICSIKISKQNKKEHAIFCVINLSSPKSQPLSAVTIGWNMHPYK